MGVYMWVDIQYPTESIVYKMNADSSGNLYVPIGGYGTLGGWGDAYNWNISIDDGASTIKSGSGGRQSSIIFSGYTAGSSHTIMITPVSAAYKWARAYGWDGTAGRTYITEVLYDGTYMGFAESATTTGAYYRYSVYSGCTNLTKNYEEVMPNTVTTISNYYRSNEYAGCTSLKAASEEAMSSSISSIGSGFKSTQYNGCTSLEEIKGWVDTSVNGSNYYRQNQFNGCTKNKTVKVLSNVGAVSYSNTTLQNAYVTTVYVPSAYLSNFTGSNNEPWKSITDSKFVGY